jgi:hypothetical protein
VLPLHECVVEPLQDATKSIADPAAADPAANESTAEPLHSVGSGAALTATFCLFVQF